MTETWEVRDSSLYSASLQSFAAFKSGWEILSVKDGSNAFIHNGVRKNLGLNTGKGCRRDRLGSDFCWVNSEVLVQLNFLPKSSLKAKLGKFHCSRSGASTMFLLKPLCYKKTLIVVHL